MISSLFNPFKDSKVVSPSTSIYLYIETEFLVSLDEKPLNCKIANESVPADLVATEHHANVPHISVFLPT